MNSPVQSCAVVGSCSVDSGLAVACFMVVTNNNNACANCLPSCDPEPHLLLCGGETEARGIAEVLRTDIQSAGPNTDFPQQCNPVEQTGSSAACLYMPALRCCHHAFSPKQQNYPALSDRVQGRQCCLARL